MNLVTGNGGERRSSTFQRYRPSPAVRSQLRLCKKEALMLKKSTFTKNHNHRTAVFRKRNAIMRILRKHPEFMVVRRGVVLKGVQNKSVGVMPVDIDFACSVCKSFHIKILNYLDVDLAKRIGGEDRVLGAFVFEM